MNSGENIFNAFEVIKKTHESINKFITYCESIAPGSGFIKVPQRFLRYNSDPNPWGWSYSNIVQLFQKETDNEFGEHGWRDGPIYVLEINLYTPDFYDIPMVNISKYEYIDITSIAGPCGAGYIGIFVDPMFDNKKLEPPKKKNEREYDRKVVNTDERKWWSLNRIVGFSIPLTDITSKNANEIIFDGFKSLETK